MLFQDYSSPPFPSQNWRSYESQSYQWFRWLCWRFHSGVLWSNLSNWSDSGAYLSTWFISGAALIKFEQTWAPEDDIACLAAIAARLEARDWRGSLHVNNQNCLSTNWCQQTNACQQSKCLSTNAMDVNRQMQVNKCVSTIKTQNMNQQGHLETWACCVISFLPPLQTSHCQLHRGQCRLGWTDSYSVKKIHQEEKV